MRNNSFLQGLRNGRQQIGIWHNLRGIAANEIVASSGFDWVLLDQEHSPRNFDEVAVALSTLEKFSVSPIVRAATHQQHEINALLDLGAQNLLIPMVETGDQAKNLVRFLDFAPRGVRGVSSQTRAGAWGQDKEFFAKTGEELCMILQIESKMGADNSVEIMETPGIGGIFVGAADLAASMGHLGNPGHPDVVREVTKIRHQALERDIPIGCLTKSATTCAAAFSEGYSFVGAGTDSFILASTLRTLLSDISTLNGESK